MTISIIIAVKTWQENLRECVDSCLRLDYPDFEILILPDGPVILPPAYQDQARIRVIPTGVVNPAKKRDLGALQAKGEVLAFIDDDAYPDKGWLSCAQKYFQDASVAAAGGPAVTPQDDSLRQKASGMVYASPIVSGAYVYRYIPRKARFVDDYPSCNFLVRSSVMRELGGFNTDFWPGEDTKLCLDITERLKKKIAYDPGILVFHHRRALFLPHLRQVASYALHRGYFVKRFPRNSFKPAYFLPSLLTLFLLFFGIAGLFWKSIRVAYLAAVYSYLSLALISSIFSGLSQKARRKPALIILAFLGIIFTHLAYGTYFLKGLLSSRLKEEA